MKRPLSIALIILSMLQSPTVSLAGSSHCHQLFVGKQGAWSRAKNSVTEGWMKSLDFMETTPGLKEALVFPIPLLPIVRAIGNKDRRFLVFIEKPILMGPITTGIAVSVARAITGTEVPWINNFLDSYVSYTLKDIVAMGVALDKKLSSKAKYWINYGYTVGTYSIVTTLTSGTLMPILEVLRNPSVASAGAIESAAYGLGLISFSVIWPFLSQAINTTIVPPILAYRFPTKTTMDLVTEKDQGTNSYKLSNSKILNQFHEKYLQAQASLDSYLNSTPASLQDSKFLKDLHANLKESRSQYLWVKWIRVGLDKGDSFPFLPFQSPIKTKPLPAKLGVWAIKNLFVATIATSMIVGYFATRDLTVGVGPGDMQILSEMFKNLLNDPNILR